ncbi:hypothetical protein Dimus_006938 [Dionaea muscipula]
MSLPVLSIRVYYAGLRIHRIERRCCGFKTLSTGRMGPLPERDTGRLQASAAREGLAACATSAGRSHWLLVWEGEHPQAPWAAVWSSNGSGRAPACMNRWSSPATRVIAIRSLRYHTYAYSRACIHMSNVSPTYLDLERPHADLHAWRQCTTMHGHAWWEFGFG